MKTYCTVPELSTIEENGIKDLVNIDKIPEQLRVLHLDGLFVRIKITKDYVELNSTEEIDLSSYKTVFKNIQKFIYKLSEVYLYGVYNDEQLEIYDIYLNENYLSTKDMKIFGKMGLPILKPIIEGNLSFNDIIKVYEIYKKFYVLPSVYINDKREKTSIISIKTKIILGEKKEYKNEYWSSTSYLDQVYPKINNLAEDIKAEEVKSFEKPEVYTATTKDERTQIFNEVYKNVSKYIEELKKTEENWDIFNDVTNQEVLDFWEKKGKEIVYLYSIYTLPKTRQIVYDYYDMFDCDDFECQSVLDSYDMSYIFLDLLTFYHSNELNKHDINFEDSKQETMFYIILKNELEVFMNFFVSESGILEAIEEENKENKNV